MKIAPHVFYHIPDPQKAQQIIELCRSLQFTAKPIRSNDAGKTVGMLTGIPGASAKTEKLPAGYVLLIEELQQERAAMLLMRNTSK